MKKNILPFLLLMLLVTKLPAQFTITNDTNTVTLVNNFILSGVSASNVQYTGAGNTLGTFNNGNTTNIGMTDGIIMTTGSLITAPFIGSMASDFASFDNGGSGDTLLDNIIPGYLTYNASVLEFDLIPAGNILEFQYVFASEEYPEFVGSTFNDVFGFFINGANPSGGSFNDFNIALIPGGSQPVAINNVNAGSNSSYFIDNQLLNGQTIVFDGFTTVLLASVNVIPYNTYHLKMAVADAGDGIFDSGIFLKAQSMKSYFTSGISENSQNSYSLYPNPATDELNLKLLNKNCKDGIVSIFDVCGQLIIQQPINSICSKIDLKSLNSGVYFIKFENKEVSEVTRIIKK